MEELNICHIFLYSRLLELIDTLWICLRKKNRQITFLHVFHHSFVLLMTWFYFKLAPGGSSVMFPIVNGTVHTIMYIYYIMSTFESLKPLLWWKKYVTEIQLMQFVILGLHFAVAALTPNCGYPRILSLSGLAIACMFFSLFIAFYKETYTSKKQQQQKELQQKLQQKAAESNMDSKKQASLDKLDDNNNSNSVSSDDNNNNNINHLVNRKINNSRSVEVKSR